RRKRRAGERRGVAGCYAFAALLDHLLRRGNQGPRKHATQRWLLVASVLLSLTGCTWDHFHLFTPPPPPPPPADKLVLRGDQLVADAPPKPGTPEADLAGAHELFRRGEYEKAARVFKYIANNTKNPVQICEEARYYEAECYRLDSYYPKAVDTYVKLLTDFPTGANREQAMQHIFEIANYWLDDTREAMREERERKDGKRWVVWPHFVQLERSKPFLDEEGRALDALEQVRYNDMVGPLADKALFLVGSVHFFNEDYKEADHYFSQLVEMHPN